jgi:hypothetical protein
MDLKDISPFKDFFQPIGELVVAFSMLETHLLNTVQMLTGIAAQEVPRDMPRRIELFETSLNSKLEDPDALAWAKDVTEDLRRANAHRVHIIHGPWNNFDPITGEATKLKFKVKGTYTYTTPQIREIASKMLSIMTRMAFLTGHALPPPRNLLKDQDLQPMKFGSSPGNCMPPCPLPDKAIE